MKKLLFGLIITLVVSGCSQQLYVSSDYDKTTDFKTYKTFSWAKEQEEPGKAYPMFDNEMNRKRIKEAIENEMEALGIKKSDSSPDILIDFHITIDQKVDYMVHDYYPFGIRYWPDYDVASYTYKKGALIIHLVDSNKEQLVWQGVGSRTLSDVPPDNVEERIQVAVKAILAEYPKANK